MEHAPLFAETDRLAALALPPHTQALLATSLLNYQRHAHLIIRLEEADFPHALFSAVQARPANGRTLSPTEITERVTEVLEPLHALGWVSSVRVG